MNLKWDIRFLKLAKEVATWSRDPSTQIGAVIVNPVTRNVLSLGYNGFPRGIEDTPSRLNDREEKLGHMVHGEMNAIFNATRNGTCLMGSTIYCHGLFVCSECAKGIIQVGITRVVASEPSPETAARWFDETARASALFEEAGVQSEVYNGKWLINA